MRYHNLQIPIANSSIGCFTRVIPSRIARIVAIDYGTKRVGLAVTDMEQRLAFPLETVSNHELIRYLDAYFEKEEVEGMIIGLPIQLDGTFQKMTGIVEDFIKHMRRRYKDKWVQAVDERFTSSLAQRAMMESGVSKKKRREKGALDRISATIILQDFLNSR